jgi:hypothetical protein
VAWACTLSRMIELRWTCSGALTIQVRNTLSCPVAASLPYRSLGEELSHELGMNTLLIEKLYFFPDLNDAGQYRGTFNFGTVTKINKWLGWQNAFGDIYVTNPPAGSKQNDILFTTGLNVSFRTPMASVDRGKTEYLRWRSPDENKH